MWKPCVPQWNDGMLYILCYSSKIIYFLFTALSRHRIPLRTIQFRKISLPQCFVRNVPIYCTLLPSAVDIIYFSQLQSPLEAESDCRTVLCWTSVNPHLDWLQVRLLPTSSCGSYSVVTGQQRVITYTRT